jgi:hypothetical protein
MLPHVDEFRQIHNLGAMEGLVRALGRERDVAANPARWLRAVAAA